MRASDKWETRPGTRQRARWSAGTCYRCSQMLMQNDEIVRTTTGWVHWICGPVRR